MRPESEAKTELGKRLRAIRTAAGNPSREEFAAKLDLNVKTIAAYERGERTPDANALAAYRECFAVNADWVVSGEGKMNRYAVLQPDRMDRAIADGRTVVRAKDPSEGLLVVDHSQTSVEHGCIYVFNVADRLVVKRARWSMDKHLTLMSDNPSPDYPDEVIKAENADQLIVVGRVVFHGSRV